MACLALMSLPGHAIDIGRASVNSEIGQPLDARVPLRMGPGEFVRSDCLSVGGSEDFPDADHRLISDVELSLLTAPTAIHVKTLQPIDASAVSLALRVQCDDGPITIRALNLYLNPPQTGVSPSVAPAPPRSTGTERRRVRASANIGSTLPGTTITVRAGDTVYGFARLIFPDNEKAVRNLAMAIVVANPARFPDGRPGPLQIGEQLTIPDLRTVQKIVADSGIAHDPNFPPAPARNVASSAASGSTISRESPGSDQPRPVSISELSAPGASRATAVSELRMAEQMPATRRTDGLGFTLALTIDLSLSEGMTEARRARLRQELQRTSVGAAPSTPGSGGVELSSRVNQVSEMQSGIDAQIARLTSQVAELQKSALALSGGSASARAPGQNVTPVSQPERTAIAPAVPTTPQSMQPVQTAANLPPPTGRESTGAMTRASASASNFPGTASATAQSTFDWWNRAPWWKWPAVAAVLLLLVGVGYVRRPKFRMSSSGEHDEERIRDIIEKARDAAEPLMGSEPPVPDDEVDHQLIVDDAEDDEFDEDAVRTTIDPSIPVLEDDAPYLPGSDSSEYADVIDLSTAGTVSQGLKREMADALDGARSMFSDVDRFIVLGRAENAISLLEYQIENHPHDRDAWVKLLAIYEQEGMEDEFDKAHVAFDNQFKGV